ncbi:hypothetical protein J3R30DRAFT_3694543 [Lentinula aciculospora]|uniref:GATA-type domain-containing protein n=1 Tax=Lentinula aciculospora TaxID=153920 RepID=A0A9W9DXJ1_9AGAR|nr:hypothetical protein J3R30DRAFT_3694543 [Lentinula aciculospora]
MPQRGFEPYPMSSHRQFERRPSPPNAPPIATLSSTNSPTTSASSLDRSSVSTPPIRRPSPHSHATSQYYHSHPQPYYSHPPPPVNHHHNHRGYDSHEGSYPVPNASQSYHNMGGMGMAVGAINGMPSGREPYGLQMPMSYPGGPINSNVPVVYTEDAATKLSDRVRRRCFNCCTTDTSTWRRSNLSPGKVLCNKCGLFERTHSRPRPEQFPHKRGPLASSTLRSRSPPAPHSISSPSMHSQSTGHGSHQSPMTSNNTLPPISPPYSYSHPPHPSLAPLNSVTGPPSTNGNHHEVKREEDHKKPLSRSWQDRVSPPISKRSPPSGRASPAPQTMSSNSVLASSKSSRSRYERDEN